MCLGLLFAGPWILGLAVLGSKTWVLRQSGVNVWVPDSDREPSLLLLQSYWNLDSALPLLPSVPVDAIIASVLHISPTAAIVAVVSIEPFHRRPVLRLEPCRKKH